MNTGIKNTYIDLFSGCGGLSLGLYQSRYWHGLFAIEKNRDAFETLKYNLIQKRKHFTWPIWLDIKEYDINYLLKEYKNKLVKLKGHVDLIVGGPPCQGFSLAGHRVENDSRNKLIHSYFEFIKIIRPKIIIFENVKAFGIGFRKEGSSIRGKPYSEILLESLINDLEYKDAQARIIKFSDFGVPQIRERMIIVGTLFNKSNDFFNFLNKNRKRFLKSKNLPNQDISLEEAIEDIEQKHGVIDSPDSKGFLAGIYKKNKLSSYQKLMRDGLEQKYPDSHRFANHLPNTISKFEYIIKNRLTPRQIQEKYDTRKTSTNLLYAKKPCLTLTTLPDDFIHYSEPRILTPREYARIQSFPDWYIFKGKYTTGAKNRKDDVPRYSQVGNAIPPLFGEQIGIAAKRIIDDANK